jgi:LysM repeat protein
MENPDDITDQNFVMRRDGMDDKAIGHYENHGHESTNESYRKRFSMPLILGATGFLILSIIMTVTISKSTNKTDSEQILVLEKRLGRIEAELISLAQDIAELRPIKRTTVRQKSSTAKKPPSAPKNDKNIKPRVYTVQAGDSLSRIGQQYGLSVGQLREYNQLESNAIIHPGQELKLTP